MDLYTWLPLLIYIVLGVDGHAVTGISGHVWNEERLEYEDVKIHRG